MQKQIISKIAQSLIIITKNRFRFPWLAKSKTLLLLSIALSIFSSFPYPLYSIEKTNKLPIELVNKLKLGKTFKTLRSDIQQKIMETGKKTVSYSGIFLADVKGRIRVDFYLPEPQSIIYDLKNLYWVFYEQKHIWKISATQAGTFLPSHPEQNLNNLLQKYKIIYKGIVHKRGQDNYYLQFFSSKVEGKYSDNDYGGEIFLSQKWLQPIEKILYNKEGKAFYKEEFSKFIQKKEIAIPTRIRVQIKKGRKLLLNDTYYFNIQINIKIPEYYFQLKTPQNFIIDDYKE